MRRCARYLVGTISILSLALAVLVAVCWARGGFRYTSWYYNVDAGPTETWAYYTRFSSYGSVSVEFDRRHFMPAYFSNRSAQEMQAFRIGYRPGLKWHVSDPTTTLLMSWPTPGLNAQHFVDTQWTGYRSDYFVFAVHPAIAMAMLLILPAFGLYRWMRTRRAHLNGLCRSCGYDLRATPERCPECGTSPKTQATKPAGAAN